MTTPSEGKPLVAPNVKNFKQTLNEISAEIKEKEAQRVSNTPPHTHPYTILQAYVRTLTMCSCIYNIPH